MTPMPKTLRLSDKEQEDLRKKSIEINKLLVKEGLQPLKDSELAHKILEKSITCVRVDKKGEIYFDGM